MSSYKFLGYVTIPYPWISYFFPNQEKKTVRISVVRERSKNEIGNGERNVKVNAKPVGGMKEQTHITSSPGGFLPQDISQRIDSVVVGESIISSNNFPKGLCSQCGKRKASRRRLGLCNTCYYENRLEVMRTSPEYIQRSSRLRES
jgi:hypothetical protein